MEEVKVHSQKLVSLNTELNDIVDKLHEGVYEYDKDEDYYLFEAYGVSPSFIALSDTFSELNYPGVDSGSEYISVNAERLLRDYRDIQHMGRVLKSKELRDFSKNLLSFLVEENVVLEE